MQRSILVLAITFVMSAAAHAASGTPKDQRACKQSVKQYCASTIQAGDMAVLACLQQNRSRISKPCRQVLVSYGQ